jgi:hypothetical protein
MGKLVKICCTRCGRDLYNSISNPLEASETHVDFYEIVGWDRMAEHYCPKCYKAIIKEIHDEKNRNN